MACVCKYTKVCHKKPPYKAHPLMSSACYWVFEAVMMSDEAIRLALWNILSQRETCFWRCRDTAVVQRESEWRSACADNKCTEKIAPLIVLQKGERWEPVSLWRDLSAQWYLWRLTHLSSDILAVLDLSLPSVSVVFFTVYARKDMGPLQHFISLLRQPMVSPYRRYVMF